uniref:hypothetical protein n=1 Tax=Methanocaldococcus vulcanius TaxID=73913 RepID=UPI00145C77AE|nr:hypothetical protein [Methanocaldococcus vulcanius]
METHQIYTYYTTVLIKISTDRDGNYRNLLRSICIIHCIKISTDRDGNTFEFT